jgi:hypothetical protein
MNVIASKPVMSYAELLIVVVPVAVGASAEILKSFVIVESPV